MVSKKDKQKIKNLKLIRTISITFGIILWVLISLISVNYEISYDMHYTNTVYDRAFDYSDGKTTDFKEGIVAMKDAEGSYENKMWMLQNKELYYLKAFTLIGLLILMLEGFLMMVISQRISWIKEFGS